MRVPLQTVDVSSITFESESEIAMLFKFGSNRIRLLGGGLPEKETDPKQSAVPAAGSSTPSPPSTPPAHIASTSDSQDDHREPQRVLQAHLNAQRSADIHALELLFWSQENNTSIAHLGNQLYLELQPMSPNAASSSSPSDQRVHAQRVHAQTSSLEAINGEREESHVEFCLSEGEWLVYQHELQLLLPFTRYAGLQSSTHFTRNRGAGSGSVDNNTVQEIGEQAQEADREGDLPLTFSPEWETSMLSLISELQASGQIMIPTALRDIAFVSAASNLVTSTVLRPEDYVSVLPAHQPLRQPSTVYVPTPIGLNSVTGVGDRIRFLHPETVGNYGLVSLIQIVSEDEHESDPVLAVQQQAPAEPSFVRRSVSADRTGRQQYLERLASQGEVRSSIVPTSAHQSEPDHSRSRILSTSQILIKRSSSTPAISTSSMSQRRFMGILPSFSQAASEVTEAAEVTTTVGCVSQPAVIRDDSEMLSRAVSAYTRTGTEPFLVTEEVSLRQTTRSETAAVETAAEWISAENVPALDDAPVHRISAAKEETAILLPTQSSTRVRKVSTGSADKRLARITVSRRCSPTVYQEQQSERHPLHDNRNECMMAATTSAFNEQKSKSCIMISENQGKNESISLPQEASNLGHSSGQISPSSSSTPSPAATNTGTASDATAKEGRISKVNKAIAK